MKDVLTPHQTRAADWLLDQEEARRSHLVVSLSGAHAYGFPSPDSDLDLKAVHVAPTEQLLGLSRPPASADRMEVFEGVELDYTSNELGAVLAGVLGGNGNYVERLVSRFALRASPRLSELQPLVRGALSTRLYRHYRGFATQQRSEWERSGFASAKKLLYVLRTTLTGAHALLTGRVETDVTCLIDEFGFSEARELVEQKKRGELAELPPALSARWQGRIEQAFAALDDALVRSVLPPEPTGAQALEAWLLKVRHESWGR